MEIAEVLALIERIIQEHKVLLQELQSTEQVATDATALRGLEEGTETFMPGRLDQSQSLRKLERLLKTVNQGLQAHFHREETALVTALKEHGDKELESDLRSLFVEHENMRTRLAHSRRLVAELIGGGLSRHIWEASAHDMRAHLTHTRKLLGTHANIEQDLLHRFRHLLQEATTPKR